MKTRRESGHVLMRKHAGLAGLIPAILFCSSFAVEPLMKASESNSLPTCWARVRTISTACLMYAQDSDGRFPAAEGWTTALAGYSQTLNTKCPAAKSPAGYLINSGIASQTNEEIEKPSETVSFFEGVGTLEGTAGTQENLSKENRHGDALIFATCDGAARPKTKKRQARLLWIPKKHAEDATKSLPQSE